HPSAAQLQEVLGYTSPRPSAPFGYTNTWGNCLGLLLGWFVVSWFAERKSLRRALGLAILAVGAIPVVYSLNRGLWIGLGLVLARTPDCESCGNPTLGSNGQLWLLLIAQGFVGAALWVGFFLRSLWAYRRDRTPIGDAGLLACGLPLFFMFVYNTLTMPLVLS